MLKPYALLAAGCLLLQATVSFAQTRWLATDRFLEVHEIWKAGETLERGGNVAGANEKYREAQLALDSVTSAFPQWQTDIVNFQTVILRQALARTADAKGGAAQTGSSVQVPANATGLLPPPGADEHRAQAEMAARAFELVVGEWKKAQPAAAAAAAKEEAAANAVASKTLADLQSENARLKQKLVDAEQQVTALRTESVKDKAEIASLKTELTGIKEQIAKLQQENNAYELKVADLTMKLKKLNDGLQDQGTAQNAKLMEENTALRNIIIRHLRQQERLRLSKELVIEEMKKMKDVSQALVENLEDMTSGKVWVTVDEEALFTEPELKIILALSGPTNTLQTVAMGDKVSSGTIKTVSMPAPASSSTKASRPKSSTKAPPLGKRGTVEDKLMVEANVALENKNVPVAQQKLQDVLRANPENTAALVGLAGIKLDEKRYDEADVLLQKALVYDSNNSKATYLLGIAAFRQGKLDTAATHFESVTKAQKDNANAHHYLGIIAVQSQNRERAETEFMNALAIDPNNADAHFNLAVLYATSTTPDFEKARQHYREAIDRQVQRNYDLEKILYPPDEAAKSASPSEKGPK